MFAIGAKWSKEPSCNCHRLSYRFVLVQIFWCKDIAPLWCLLCFPLFIILFIIACDQNCLHLSVYCCLAITTQFNLNLTNIFSAWTHSAPPVQSHISPSSTNGPNRSTTTGPNGSNSWWPPDHPAGSSRYCLLSWTLEYIDHPTAASSPWDCSPNSASAAFQPRRER